MISEINLINLLTFNCLEVFVLYFKSKSMPSLKTAPWELGPGGSLFPIEIIVHKFVTYDINFNINLSVL